MYRLFFANKAVCRGVMIGFLFLWVGILMPACDGGSSSDDSETGSAVFSLQWPDKDQSGDQTATDWHASDDMGSDPLSTSLYAAGYDECQFYGVTTITCDVYDENETWMGGDSFKCSAHRALVKNISAGENFIFAIKAMGGPDIVLYEAEVTGTISPGKTTDLGVVELVPAMPESGPDSCEAIAEGNSWTYRFTLPDTETVTGTTTITSYTDPKIYFQHVGYDFNTGWDSTIDSVSLITEDYFAHESLTTTSVMASGVTMVATMDYDPALPTGFRDLDKKNIGDTIQGSSHSLVKSYIDNALVSSLETDIDVTITVVDDAVAVDVPAGHFDNAIMVTIETTTTHEGRSPTTSTTTEWWVCGIGYVKAVDSESGNTTELESYSVWNGETWVAGGGDEQQTEPHTWSSYIIPEDPEPFEDVVVVVDVNREDITVSYEVVGTDGYEDSGSMVSDNNGEIRFFIPGGEEGVRDDITVSVLAWGPDFVRTFSYFF